MKTRRHSASQFRNETPFLRLLIPFIAGILFQLFYPVSFYMPYLFLMAILCLLILHTFIKKFSGNWKFRTGAGLMLQLSFLLAGICITCINTESVWPGHIKNCIMPDQIYMASIAKPVSEKPSSYKTIVEIMAVSRMNKWDKASGKVLIYLKKDTGSASLAYGDVICFSAELTEINQPLNPEEFNYKQFLSFHQVFLQAYLKTNSWQKVSANNGNKIIAMAYRIRGSFIEILRRNIAGKREFAVASALVVGYDDEVDKELISAYSGAGALHILSVSGMHVGLIYQGLFLLLGFMIRKRWSRHLMFGFLICFIWFYAFLTGFSPSVARSAVMLSLVIIGKWSAKGTNVFNTLLITAFFLLIYNPFYITEVGFQLSFLAVWGIIYFHPKIFIWFEPSGRIMHWVWEITSISLAAQLTTFPLGLLYFHQFPNLFMLSNLIVIPLSGIIIYACIALLVVSPVALLCSCLGKITCYMLGMLNESVLTVEKLPGSIVNNIHISFFETSVIYLIVAFLTTFFISRKAIYFQLTLFHIILLNASQLIEKSTQINQKQFVVYSIPRQKAIDIIYGESHVFITDSNFAADKSGMSFHVMPNWCKLGLKNPKIITSGETTPNILWEESELLLKDNFIYFGKKKIFLADKKSKEKLSAGSIPIKHKMKVDYILVSENAINNLNLLTRLFEFKKLIIDSSNSSFQVKKWVDECKKYGISYYSVTDEGAFVEKM